jgi:hypothetical protein
VTFTAVSWGLVSIVGYLLPVCQPLHSRVPLGAVVLLNTQLPCVAFDALFIRYSARPLQCKLVLDQFSVRRERFHYFHFLWRSAEQYIIHLLLRRCSIIIFRIPRGRSTSLFLLFVNFHEGLLRHDSGSLFVHIRCARQTGRKGGHAEGRAR